jgi:lipoprotein-anchoring transpeptidase ErfK/SrfK
LEIQVALVRQGISPGSIDGRSGGQTAAALRAFQLQQGFTPTGWLDKNTRSVLQLDRPAVRTMILEAVDLGALQPIQKTWLGKAEQTEMAYATAVEFAAEKNGASPTLVRSLNPDVDWNAPVAGTTITVPDAEYPPPRRAARANVSLSGHWLRVFDSTGYLLAHFPCSIARLAEKRPVGELHITVMIRNPNYTFDPAVFPESEEAQQIGRKLIIPPGPNNPVGVAWIGLDRPGYGIHGTPNPEEVGRTESHGCFRLANWNAEYFRRMAWTGMPITVEP